MENDRLFIFNINHLQNQKEVFFFFFRWLFNKNIISNSSRILSQLTERENAGSTQISNNMVMPHIIVKEIKHSIIMILRFNTSIKWNNTLDISHAIFIITPNVEDKLIKCVISSVSKYDMDKIIDTLNDNELKNFILKG